MFIQNILIYIIAIIELLSLIFNGSFKAGIFAGDVAKVQFQVMANMLLFRHMSNNNGIIKLFALSGKIPARSILIASIIFFVVISVLFK